MGIGDDTQIHKVVAPDILGREECVNNLLLKLIPQKQGNNDDDDDDLRIISVVNSGVTGKTALARSVYDTLDVKRWFAYRAWVHVQDNFTVGDILANILRQISTQEMKNVDVDDENGLSFRLHEYFFKQRCLVVLDNLNSDSLTVKLLTFLNDTSNGSRVIITTRNDHLPDLIDPWTHPFKFDPLTEDHRKQLLFLCSTQNELPGQFYPSRLHLMQRILSWSSLPPAGIRLLGGLLSVTRDSGKSDATIGRLAENPSLADILCLCYDDLSRELQRCIMYLCLFPREYEIPTRRLLRLWLAENLAPATQGGIQDVETCFQQLVSRNMIYVVSGGKGNGFAKTCRMPGYIYDFLLQKALETDFFEIYRSDRSTNKGQPKFVAPRIMVAKATTNESSSSEAHKQSNQTRYNIEQLRTIISINTKKNKTEKRGLDVFLNRGEKSSLEVLDLEGVYKPVLPKNLGKVLSNLRYLGLRWTIVDKLPKSVGDLPFLETLDMKHTNITIVPKSIWRKKSLRHLYLNEVSFDESFLQRLKLSPSRKLPSKLETLSGLHVEEKSPILDALRKLTGIKKLSLTCPSTIMKKVMERINGLTTLQSLKFKSKDLLGQPSQFHLEDMNGLTSLCNLYLFGDLRGNNMSFLPRNLKSLTLSMTFLNNDAMDILVTLECLTDLQLYAFSYNGTTLTCARGTFPHLRVLKLWKLGNLESLVVQEEAIPCLEELDIRDCQKLGEIQVLGVRKGLREVGLAKLKEELAQRVEASLGKSIIITTELVASPKAKDQGSMKMKTDVHMNDK